MNELSCEKIFEIIKENWLAFAEQVRAKTWVVGISGGVDSAVVAALAAKIFNRTKVFGVMLPCGEQKDIADAQAVIDHIGCQHIELNIKGMMDCIRNDIVSGIGYFSEQAAVNAPARLRMTTLYAVAQTVGGIVLNTCNRSESVVGNDTLFGDDCGSYAPIQRLTKGEVVKLAEWLGLPYGICHKIPIDGLQPLTDEERLGVSYSVIDKVVRGDWSEVSQEEKDLVMKKFEENKFKLKMIKIEGPMFPELNDEFDNFF